MTSTITTLNSDDLSIAKKTVDAIINYCRTIDIDANGFPKPSEEFDDELNNMMKEYEWSATLILGELLDRYAHRLNVAMTEYYASLMAHLTVGYECF